MTGRADADDQACVVGVISCAPKLRFHAASEIDKTFAANAQADLHRHILRAFAGRGLLESLGAKEMLADQHSGFSVDASAYIEAQDRAALEHLRAATPARRSSL